MKSLVLAPKWKIRKLDDVWTVYTHIPAGYLGFHYVSCFIAPTWREACAFVEAWR